MTDFKNGRLVDEMWWEGPDFFIRYKDGSVQKFLNAYLTDYGMSPAEDEDIKVTEITVDFVEKE